MFQYKFCLCDIIQRASLRRALGRTGVTLAVTSSVCCVVQV